jgi:putative transposase
VTTLATLSNGQTIQSPKPHKTLLKRLRRANKAQARKRHGSRNFTKAKRRLARLHARINHIRQDALHKLTTMLTKSFRRIGIEDLNVQGMVRNRHLARSIMDAGFSEFRRQLEYKARQYGATITLADRFFPSSKRCSCCGLVKAKLALSQRTYQCDECGYKAGRDFNAARNLEHLAVTANHANSREFRGDESRRVSAGIACGEGRSGAARKPRVKRASVKQEPDNTLAAYSGQRA